MSERYAAQTTVRAAFLVVFVVVLVGGCRGRVRSTSAPVAETRVGVVDLQVVTRAHPRWQELDAVAQQLQDVQAQLALLPAAPAMPEADVAGLTSEEEAKQLQRQVQALQDEREQRIAAKADETQKAFVEFQKAKEDEINAKLKTAQGAVQAEAQRRLLVRQQELQEELRHTAAGLEETFRARLDRRRKELLAAAQGPVRGRQGAFAENLGERNRRLRAEMVSLQEQRVRLEDGILAEVKIEIAAIAQDRKLDVVLTRFVTNVAGIDITSDVVQKLKR